MRRMITEKDADKLRFIKDDEANSIISFINDDDAEIALDGDDIEIWSVNVQYINPEDDHTYFKANPKNGVYMNLPLKTHIKKGIYGTITEP